MVELILPGHCNKTVCTRVPTWEGNPCLQTKSSVEPRFGFYIHLCQNQMNYITKTNATNNKEKWKKHEETKQNMFFCILKPKLKYATTSQNTVNICKHEAFLASLSEIIRVVPVVELVCHYACLNTLCWEWYVSMLRKTTHSRDQTADKSPRSGFHEALWTSCLILVCNLKFPQCNVYKTGDIFCLELGSIPLEHVPLMVFHQFFVPRQQWTKHAALDKTWQFQPNMTRDFTEPCLCIAEHTFISISDRLFIWVITRFK